jgi:subtilisin family serine protease
MNEASTWVRPEQARVALKTGKGRGIKVAIIDSGIELSHPWLRHLRLLDDMAFTVNQNGVVHRTVGWGEDVNGHGSAQASIILRAAPEVQIGSFRALDKYQCSKYSIVEEAARTAIDRGYNIINLSFGAVAAPDTIVHFKPWIDYAYTQGVHIVSACSNNDFREGEWPGYFPSVITVNMCNTQREDLFFRWDPPQKGKVTHLVEFAARGLNIEVAWKNGTVIHRQGSSFAAPHVAGLLARLLSVYPSIKPLVAKSLLQEAAQSWTPEIEAVES